MQTPDTKVPVINYDAGGYDYRQFWNGRDYELWAEAGVLRRLLHRAGNPEWMVDLGGGFGRNIPVYLERAQHAVLVDYSWTNLTNAEQTLLADGQNAGRVFLIRANIYHLPFRDGAFDLGSTVRVLHHLAATNDAMAEMGRVIAKNWMLDVPIKHHMLARVRASLRGKGRSLRTREANDIGTPEEPFYNFHLGAIREALRAQGWKDQLVASVANFRRWERAVPRFARGAARPFVYGAELAAQPLGRGWWGPAQFLWLTRREPLKVIAVPSEQPVPTSIGDLAPRLCCPQCHGDLTWATDQAQCTSCQRVYQSKGAIWDFVVE